MAHVDEQLKEMECDDESEVGDEDIVDLFPPVVAAKDDDGKEWFVPERYQGVPANDAVFMCPKCRRYTANASELDI